MTTVAKNDGDDRKNDATSKGKIVAEKKKGGGGAHLQKIAKDPQSKAKNASCGEGRFHRKILTPPTTPAQNNIIIVVFQQESPSSLVLTTPATLRG